MIGILRSELPLSANKIEIIGIQEHRRVSEDEITFAKKSGIYLITSAWRNTQQAATGVVGLFFFFLLLLYATAVE